MVGLSKIFLRHLSTLPEGQTVRPSDFLHLGGRPSVDQFLSRAVRSGLLVRIARGLYRFAPVCADAADSRLVGAIGAGASHSGRRRTGKGLLLEQVTIDRSSTVPVNTQLYQSLIKMLRNGSLTAGKRLPSSRLLALELSVSRNTILSVYSRLNSEGYLAAKHGVGTIIADHGLQKSEQIRNSGVPSVQRYKVRETSVENMLSRYETRPVHGEMTTLRPFNPNIELFPFKTWRKLMSRRSMLGGGDLFGYGHLLGYTPVRHAIAEYIAAYRGVQCDWRQVIVTNGAQGAINLISHVLLDRGDAVWMEEPGYHWARFSFLSRGAELVPLHVDPHKGWKPTRPNRPIQLVYVTPSCQQPLCKSMALETRHKLLEIAAEQGAWIIEDDYDSEFSNPVNKVPAIQGLDTQGRTIYVGTFAKTMFPTLRIGFMVLPETLLDVVERIIPSTGNIPNLSAQAALCDFLEGDFFASHIRRMKNFYAIQRQIFLDAVQEHLSRWLTPAPGCVGLQVPLLLRDGLSDAFAAGSHAARYLGPLPLSAQYYLDEAVHGFVLGYAAPRKRDLINHIVKFAELLRDEYRA